ncbi:MAG: HAD-IA family hydrolase [Candidatus Shapirobacteria bacterium]
MIEDDGYFRPDNVSVDIQKIIENYTLEFIESGNLIGQAGLAIGSGGNTSIKVPGGMLITSTGSILSDLKQNEIIFVIGATNNSVYFIGDKKPSSEALLHWSIYLKRPDITAIAHVNVGPKNNIKIITSPRELAYGTDLLAKKTALILKNNNTMMMANHGVVAVGDTLISATKLVIKIADKNKNKFTSTIKNRKIKIQHLLIDIHGVLTQGDEKKKFINLLSKRYSIDSEKHNSIWLEHLPDLDIGKEKSIDYLNTVNKILKTNFNIKQYFRQFAQQIIPNQKLINKLKKYTEKTIIVSDNVLELSQAINCVFELDFKNFRKFYSYQFGKTKSSGMLEDVIKKINTNPSSCLFIDDSERNIDTAKKLGINAILFKNNEELFYELKKYRF